MEISNNILEETEDSQTGQRSGVHPLDAQFTLLGLTVETPFDLNSAEFDHLEKYLYHSKEGYSPTSNTTIQHTHRFSRSSEVERFIPGGYDPSGMKTSTVQDHRRLIWHGSRGCNFGGILSQGLRIASPKASANGKAIGKGIYLALVNQLVIVILGHSLDEPTVAV